MLNRTLSPKIIDAVDFNLALPPYQKHTLSNGVQVFAIDLGEQDTLMINWVFFAGNWYEEKNLVAATTNHLLKNGTSRKNAFAINEHFDFYGSYINRHCHNETADITLHCLGKHVHHLLPVVSELFTDAIFPQEEINIFKKNMQQRLQVNLMNTELEKYQAVTAEQILNESRKIFDEKNSNTMYYYSNN